MNKGNLAEMIALLFVALFLYTGISKIMDYYIFKEQIALSPLLKPFAGLVAILLPVSEILISIILFIPYTRRIGLYSSLALMVLFTGYILYILKYNDHLPCTCGGFIQALSWPQHLLFNGVLIMLLFVAIRINRRSIQTI